MLKPNDLVRVKSFEQIIQTLDDEGCLDGLPFMPEMIDHCGKIFRVSLKVEKTCVDNPTMYMAEFRNNDVYFLEDLRCSGIYHDGCQRYCRLFWKESWLEVVRGNPEENEAGTKLKDEIIKQRLKTKQSEEIYFCQSTQLRNATKPLSAKEKIFKLFKDVQIGTYNFYEALKLLIQPLIRKVIKKIKDQHPKGELTKTPEEVLNLQPGELVQVRSFEEILKTLDKRGKNKGLSFEPDMKMFCGKQFTVRNRLEKMILERNGKMVEVKNSVILDGVTCECFFAFGGCPRKEFQYWREIWLKRIN
ncbi:hypothetical protein [Ignavibacterium sp.]|uniref:hypothetical protein n=1 Tax=Ignavibacterium sp. TaxID=2651167 RepID=UPI00220FC0B3|nr:hypothetical protein [Ignavibacterium sp.]BDQ02802.1 MAG: hypothetical protein KatS3mg037_1377 [Ignavibacterium sp.]